MARAAQTLEGEVVCRRRRVSLFRWFLLAMFVVVDGQQIWDTHWTTLAWCLLFTGLLLPNYTRLTGRAAEVYQAGIALVLVALGLEVLVRLAV
jgi:hypothetical protein